MTKYLGDLVDSSDYIGLDNFDDLNSLESRIDRVGICGNRYDIIASDFQEIFDRSDEHKEAAIKYAVQAVIKARAAEGVAGIVSAIASNNSNLNGPIIKAALFFNDEYWGKNQNEGADHFYNSINDALSSLYIDGFNENSSPSP